MKSRTYRENVSVQCCDYENDATHRLVKQGSLLPLGAFLDHYRFLIIMNAVGGGVKPIGTLRDDRGVYTAHVNDKEVQGSDLDHVMSACVDEAYGILKTDEEVAEAVTRARLQLEHDLEEGERQAEAARQANAAAKLDQSIRQGRRSDGDGS